MGLVFLLIFYVLFVSSFSLELRESRIYGVNPRFSRRDNVINITDYICGRTAFCDDSVSKYDSPHCFECKTCHCDDICSFYGDCCPDRLFDSNTDRPIPPSTYTSCERQHPRQHPYKEDESTVFMVTSCPKESTAQDMIKSRCEQPSPSSLKQSTPVSVVSTKITYRNAYCAICHQQHDYIDWRHEVKCDKRDFLSYARDKDQLWYFVLQEESCTVKRFPPENIARRVCFTVYSSPCFYKESQDSAHQLVEELCRQYYSPVKSTTGMTYRNPLCATSMCGGEKINRQLKCLYIKSVLGPKVIAPLSVLIDFNPKRRLMASPPLPEVKLTKCNDTELFDPFSESCRPADCPLGRVMAEGQCELILKTAAGVGYSGSLVLKFSENISLTQWSKVVKEFVYSLRSNLRQYKPFIFSQLKHTFYTVPYMAESAVGTSSNRFMLNVSGVLVEFDFVSSSQTSVLGMENTLRNLHSEISLHTVDGKTGVLTSIPVPCLSRIDTILEGLPDKAYSETDKPFRECGPRTCGYTEDSNEECADVSCNFDLVIYRSVLNILDCPHLQFRLGQYNLKYSEEISSISMNGQVVQLNKSKYRICDDIIKICSSELQRFEHLMTKSEISETQPGANVSFVSVSPAMSTVSFVFILISLLCLLLTFLVFCFLPQLQTLPGKNTMVLVVYLFLAQLIFQIGSRMTYSRSLCLAMGVLIHYLWIATFMTTATSAFHMYTVFTQISPPNSRYVGKRKTWEETKKVIRYVVIGNGISTVVIGVCIGYNAGVSRGIEIGYGGDVCFLNSPLNIGIFFATPLGVVLIFNTVCFICVVRTIRSVPNLKTNNHEANRNNVNIYFRLSILLGFTWIFGFVAAWLQLEWLWYIFLVMNGLQGLFIFIARCLNKRILNILKARCCLPKIQNVEAEDN